ncbi:hypothetical protein pb186bvf_002141 [Paramecium bursaria]
MNEQIKLLTNYLDATNETSVDHFDSLVNHILQHPNDQIIKYIKDQMDMIDIKQKIRILQLIDELITSNDKYLYDAIKNILYDKLTDYYNHQQQVTSNYLNQEDQIEIIELYIYVNKILGQFNNQENQSMISVFKTQEQIIQSRPSIVLEENIQQYNYYDEKYTQTDEDQEISQWKLKWELQVRYNQRLQKINQQLRDDKLQLYQQIDQLTKQLKPVEQDEIIINQDDDEDDDIIINDIEEIKSPPSIIKKQQNDVKKQVQFQSNKQRVYYQQELFGSIITQLNKYNSIFNYKKSCLLNQSILFDDKNITIHMQSSLTQPNYIQFVFTFINKTKSIIQQFMTKYTNQHIPVPEFNRIAIQSKQYQRQTINLQDSVCFILISFKIENEQYRYQIPTPNFQTKFIDSIQMNMKEYRQKWNQSKQHYQRLMSDYVKMNITVDEKRQILQLVPIIRIRNLHKAEDR